MNISCVQYDPLPAQYLHPFSTYVFNQINTERLQLASLTTQHRRAPSLMVGSLGWPLFWWSTRVGWCPAGDTPRSAGGALPGAGLWRQLSLPQPGEDGEHADEPAASPLSQGRLRTRW